MQRNTLVLAACAALLLSAPALAQSSPGYEGDDPPLADGVGAASRVELPATLPLPAPRFPTSPSTGFAPTSDDFGTVSMQIGGTAPTTSAAAPEIAGLLAAKPPQPPGAMAGAAMPASADLGKLVVVKKTTSYPFRAVGALFVTYPNGSYSCTGTLIGDHAVLTSAECLYGLDGSQSWATEATFYPGLNGRSGVPYGPYTGTVMRIATGFFNHDFYFYYNFGLLILNQHPGKKLGWLGFQTDMEQEYQPASLSYNNGRPDDYQRSTTCAVPIETMEYLAARPTPCKSGGYGAPLYVQDSASKARYVTELAYWGASDKDPAAWAVRISPPIYQWLIDNMN